MKDVVCPGCPKGWCKGCVPVILTDEDKAQMKAQKTGDKNVPTVRGNRITHDLDRQPE